jgi:hypothetical protein
MILGFEATNDVGVSMTTNLLVRRFFLVALAVAALGYGCGRTSLDDGLVGADGLGGVTGAGGGGTASGGAAGALGGPGGSNAPNPCGASSCRADSQVCCSRLVGGQTAQSCVAANNPALCANGVSTACLGSSQCGAGLTCCLSIVNLSTTCSAPTQCATGGGFTLCTSSGGCPNTAPRCCLQAPGLGVCLPTSVPCIAR